MKVFVKLLSVLLSLMFLFGIVTVCDEEIAKLLDVFSIFATANNNYSLGDTIEFGSYPQSRVTNDSIIKKLNSQTGTWESYNYYSGTNNQFDGKMVPGNWMRYKDVTYNGDRYRAVIFDNFRPYTTGHTADYSYQWDNNYLTDTVYWFKYEPLKWTVIDPSDCLLLCNTIIDSQPYSNFVLLADDGEYYEDTAKKYYSSNYSVSYIRSWLNNEFYNSAFDNNQQLNIVTSSLQNKSTCDSSCDSPLTNDKVFLISYWDSVNPKYQFDSSDSYSDSRTLSGTDYAKCQGLFVDETNGNSCWWLRSPLYSDTARFVGEDGDTKHGYKTNYAFVGVRPAVRLSELKSDILENDDEGFPFKFHQKYVISDFLNKYSQYSRIYGGDPMDGSLGNAHYGIPGLSSEDNMVPQGMTYYPAKNWILISAYDAKEKNESVIYALDYNNGNYVAEYHLYDGDGKKIINHVGGIAATDDYLFIATGKYISYISLSKLVNKTGKAFNVKTEGKKSLSPTSFLGKNASVSYLNYSEGVLWAGNYFYSQSKQYNIPVSETVNSRIVGFNISSLDNIDSFKVCSSPFYTIDIDKDYTSPLYSLDIDDKSSNEIEGIQCVTYANGVLYIGCSYNRKEDSSMYVGAISLIQNGHVKVSKSDFTEHKLLPMSEGMFIKAGYMYVLSESAAYKYNGESDNLSKNPTDVIWRYGLSFSKSADYNFGDETYSFYNYSDEHDKKGHCFGMSVTSSGYYLGYLNKSDIGGNDRDSLYSYSDNSQIREPICRYHRIQGSAEKKSIVAGGYIDSKNCRSSKEVAGLKKDITGDWNACVKYVKNHQHDNQGDLQVGLWYYDGGGHAVNFLYYLEVDGQQRIYIYDNNYPNPNEEKYFYLSDDGSIREGPSVDNDFPIVGIDLMDINKYYSLAEQYKPSRYIFGKSNEITIENAEMFLMKADSGANDHVIFEIPDDLASITITPLVNNATFTYMEKTYSFGDVNEKSKAIFTLSTSEEVNNAHFSIDDHTDYITEAKVNIRNFTSSRSESFKTTITFVAVSENVPTGAAVHWFINGVDCGTGNTYKVEKAAADYTVQTKLIGSNGSILAESEVETVKISHSFFAKLIAFFRTLFGTLPVKTQ